MALCDLLFLCAVRCIHLFLRLQGNHLTNSCTSLLKYTVISGRQDHNHCLWYTYVSDCLLEVQANCSGYISKLFSCQIHKKPFRLIPLYNYTHSLPCKWLRIECGGLLFTFHRFWKPFFTGNALIDCYKPLNANVVGFYVFVVYG